MTREEILRKAETIMDKQDRDHKFYWSCKKANICPNCGGDDVGFYTYAMIEEYGFRCDNCESAGFFKMGELNNE